MADARAKEVASDAAPRDCTVHQAHMEKLFPLNIFVFFDAFATSFCCGFAIFVVIPTFYDPRNAMQRFQCEGFAAPERKNLHFNFASNHLAAVELRCQAFFHVQRIG